MGVKRIKKDSMLSGMDSLDNDSRVRILGIIDKLRELGVSKTVYLPQLVVVGDQSSGKSSLLEALTGLSFPIASDLCTRYATQIVLRRSRLEDAGAKISIIPGRKAQTDDDEMKGHLLSFEQSLPLDQFGLGGFTRIFDEAAEYMGVPGPTTENLENLKKRFSDDILKIELSGPEQRHCTKKRKIRPVRYSRTNKR
ncbi:uncharacterized protein APUU_60800A [Aspergillus puulaauensis]|uniref:Dynamin N-terminal domain-containing protein n=1 Tax=Aspergillus puulaauensis TaxID=1220207 RepID=A0A7R7XUQ9_9EURO|nr:uncharacterized protein APUU_60800A [Aspergillus puulaauensis]BCS27752.1 hypothetical protein APUU_60800A [Aspergillus puulaauensis]